MDNYLTRQKRIKLDEYVNDNNQLKQKKNEKYHLPLRMANNENSEDINLKSRKWKSDLVTIIKVSNNSDISIKEEIANKSKSTNIVSLVKNKEQVMSDGIHNTDYLSCCKKTKINCNHNFCLHSKFIDVSSNISSTENSKSNSNNSNLGSININKNIKKLDNCRKRNSLLNKNTSNNNNYNNNNNKDANIINDNNNNNNNLNYIEIINDDKNTQSNKHSKNKEQEKEENSRCKIIIKAVSNETNETNKTNNTNNINKSRNLSNSSNSDNINILNNLNLINNNNNNNKNDCDISNNSNNSIKKKAKPSKKTDELLLSSNKKKEPRSKNNTNSYYYNQSKNINNNFLNNRLIELNVSSKLKSVPNVNDLTHINKINMLKNNELIDSNLFSDYRRINKTRIKLIKSVKEDFSITKPKFYFKKFKKSNLINNNHIVVENSNSCDLKKQKLRYSINSETKKDNNNNSQRDSIINRKSIRNSNTNTDINTNTNTKDVYFKDEKKDSDFTPTSEMRYPSFKNLNNFVDPVDIADNTKECNNYTNKDTNNNYIINNCNNAKNSSFFLDFSKYQFNILRCYSNNNVNFENPLFSFNINKNYITSKSYNKTVNINNEKNRENDIIINIENNEYNSNDTDNVYQKDQNQDFINDINNIIIQENVNKGNKENMEIKENSDIQVYRHSSHKNKSSYTNYHIANNYNLIGNSNSINNMNSNILPLNTSSKRHSYNTNSNLINLNSSKNNNTNKDNINANITPPFTKKDYLDILNNISKGLKKNDYLLNYPMSISQENFYYGNTNNINNDNTTNDIRSSFSHINISNSKVVIRRSNNNNNSISTTDIVKYANNTANDLSNNDDKAIDNNNNNENNISSDKKNRSNNNLSNLNLKFEFPHCFEFKYPHDENNNDHIKIPKIVITSNSINNSNSVSNNTSANKNRSYKVNSSINLTSSRGEADQIKIKDKIIDNKESQSEYKDLKNSSIDNSKQKSSILKTAKKSSLKKPGFHTKDHNKIIAYLKIEDEIKKDNNRNKLLSCNSSINNEIINNVNNTNTNSMNRISKNICHNSNNSKSSKLINPTYDNSVGLKIDFNCNMENNMRNDHTNDNDSSVTTTPNNNNINSNISKNNASNNDNIYVTDLSHMDDLIKQLKNNFSSKNKSSKTNKEINVNDSSNTPNKNITNTNNISNLINTNTTNTANNILNPEMKLPLKTRTPITKSKTLKMNKNKKEHASINTMNTANSIYDTSPISVIHHPLTNSQKIIKKTIKKNKNNQIHDNLNLSKLDYTNNTNTNNNTYINANANLSNISNYGNFNNSSFFSPNRKNRKVVKVKTTKQEKVILTPILSNSNIPSRIRQLKSKQNLYCYISNKCNNDNNNKKEINKKNTCNNFYIKNNDSEINDIDNLINDTKFLSIINKRNSTNNNNNDIRDNKDNRDNKDCNNYSRIAIKDNQDVFIFPTTNSNLNINKYNYNSNYNFNLNNNEDISNKTLNSINSDSCNSSNICNNSSGYGKMKVPFKINKKIKSSNSSNDLSIISNISEEEPFYSPKTDIINNNQEQSNFFHSKSTSSNRQSLPIPESISPVYKAKNNFKATMMENESFVSSTFSPFKSVYSNGVSSIFELIPCGVKENDNNINDSNVDQINRIHSINNTNTSNHVNIDSYDYELDNTINIINSYNNINNNINNNNINNNNLNKYSKNSNIYSYNYTGNTNTNTNSIKKKRKKDIEK